MSDHCTMCDDNGFAEILPDTAIAHATLVHCPHNAAALLAIKRRVEDERDYEARRRRPRPQPDDEVF